MFHVKHDIDGIKDSLLSIGIDISDAQSQQFLQYYEMLIEKNKVMNLTAITEFDDVVMKHFIDSLIITKYLDFNNVRSMIDIGTGAGFPGIPLKIVFPDVKVTLMDSLNKRIDFLNEVIERLKLNNISAVHERAETLGHNEKFREKYDLCVSRAVANLSVLSEYTIPFVKAGGYFAAYKGSDIDKEVDESKKAISILGGTLENIYSYKLPDNISSRSIILIKKTKPTGKKYPRKPGTPKKEPLQ